VTAKYSLPIQAKGPMTSVLFGGSEATGQKSYDASMEN